jgi:hypothetical protein
MSLPIEQAPGLTKEATHLAEGNKLKFQEGHIRPQECYHKKPHQRELAFPCRRADHI